MTNIVPTSSLFSLFSLFSSWCALIESSSSLRPGDPDPVDPLEDARCSSDGCWCPPSIFPGERCLKTPPFLLFWFPPSEEFTAIVPPLLLVVSEWWVYCARMRGEVVNRPAAAAGPWNSDKLSWPAVLNL